MCANGDLVHAPARQTMTFKTAIMALGAVLLLVAGITLPAAAAGWGTGSGSNQSSATSGTCPQCPDCDQTLTRLQNQTGNQSGFGLQKGPNGTTPDAGQTNGQHGQCLGIAAGQRGVGDAGAGQGSGRCLGDCDQARLRQRLQDGSCGARRNTAS